MLEKYQVNSYPEKFLGDNSDINVGKVKSILANKKTTYINPKKYLGNSFQPESIYKMENDNISGYQLDLKSSCRDSIFHDSKYNMTERGHRYNNYKKSGSLLPQENMEEMDSCYSSSRGIIDKYLNNNKINSLNKKINKNKLLNQTDEQIQKRRIKSIQSKFNVQKRDNFNVLSYRPEEDETNLIKLNGKIIQIFKKQDVGELFIPSNRIQTPLSSTHSSVKKEGKLLSCQNPALKFQSFFGTFVKPKHHKITKQAKSLSKIKLEDYNIDKLIEIGDNYENKWTPILSFGKKIKSIKNKMRLKNKRGNKNNIIKNIYNNYRKQNNEDENQENNELEISDNKYNTNNNINGIHIHNNDQININNEKDIFSKKYKYHGQISRKRNIIKNAKTYKAINQTKDDAIKNENKEENSAVYKNITINNEKIEESNNSQKKLNNSSSKLKRNSQTANQKISAFSHNKNNINKTKENLNHFHHEIVPQKNTLRRKIELPLNNNTFNYTLNKNISSYTNVNSIIERNKYLNNCKNINVNEENKDKVAQKDKINDNAVEENKQNVKKIPIGEGENYKKYTKANNNCSVNSSINFNSNTNIILNDTNNQIGKKITESSFKTKKYYGYDSYNLEGAINNHSYYESVYSKKKGVQKNHSFGKIN